MMTTTVRREKRFTDKPLQLRVPAQLQERLARMSVKFGLDKSTLARMALNSGLASMQKHLPPQVE